jgi:hypothetical protein
MDHSHPRFNDHINVDALTARRAASDSYTEFAP